MYERISYLYKLLKNNRLGFKNLMINVLELLKKIMVPFLFYANIMYLSTMSPFTNIDLYPFPTHIL